MQSLKQQREQKKGAAKFIEDLNGANSLKCAFKLLSLYTVIGYLGSCDIFHLCLVNDPNLLRNHTYMSGYMYFLLHSIAPLHWISRSKELL